MPDDPSDRSSPETENNLPEAPALRPAPLQSSDKADKGCLVMLAFLFVGVFLFPAFFFLGGAIFIVPCLLCFLVAMLAPYINPMENRGTSPKWWGRIVSFVVMAGVIITIWYRIFWKEETAPPDVRQTHGLRGPVGGHAVPSAAWS
jgi:hypothetical protein